MSSFIQQPETTIEQNLVQNKNNNDINGPPLTRNISSKTLNVSPNQDLVSSNFVTNSLSPVISSGSIKNSPISISTNSQNGTTQLIGIDETPNKIVYKKIETLIEKMQDDSAGVPIRTVKSFMSKIPSVFTGTDLIQWMLKNLDVEDTCEALHFAHLIASHGYMFPIDDHILTVKNDGTFFRFQVK